MWKAILVLLPALISVIGVIVLSIDMWRHFPSYKRKHGRCWMFNCHRKVKNCLAGPDNNGPMCDEHCSTTSYHAHFSGCGEPDGVPTRMKTWRRLIEDASSRIPKDVQGRRIDKQKLLN